MTLKFRQHIPNFVSGVEPVRGEASTVTELLAQEFVQRWANRSDFDRFTRHARGEEVQLMAEMLDGKFWVVAFVTPKEVLDELPVWQA